VSALTTNLFDYSLPAHLIAQKPAPRRDQSRLLVVDRITHTTAHHTFAELPTFLRAGDTLFRNNAAVLPARLFAHRPSGGHVECFLLSMGESPDVWRCLIKPGKKLPVGAVFGHSSGAFQGEILNKAEDGSAFVRFSTSGGEPITVVANRIGQVPLPPYISREQKAVAGSAVQRAGDIERYQTVYADPARQVAVAAPTAGLHFTPELLEEISSLGVQAANLTLHVGLGTFQPITADLVQDHAIHRELYEIPAATQRALFPPHSGRRIAVGTTTVRTIEDFLASHDAPTDRVQSHISEAAIFIYPPRPFRGVDALITNFHQPRSTLLCLVAAFLTPGSTAGIDWLREIYADAIAREYRFFSYGDAMLIL
jgi:S-adenosylmethionine:tRNA ribosyltransferase-isomerase